MTCFLRSIPDTIILTPLSPLCKDQNVVYNFGMAKETTIEKKIDALTNLVEKGFGAVAGDITGIKGDITGIKKDVTDIKRNMATKDQIIALHTQVNSIESQIRGMKHVKLEGRVADLEEKFFGEVRA